jgi:LysM repeat protein
MGRHTKPSPVAKAIRTTGTMSAVAGGVVLASMNHTPPHGIPTVVKATAYVVHDNSHANQQAEQFYTVVAGDWLAKIAQNHCGTYRDWPALYVANKQTVGPNPNLIFPGQRLRLDCSDAPQAPASPTATSASASPTADPVSSGETDMTRGYYVNPLSKVANLRPERIDQGADFSGSGPVLAIGNAVITETNGGGWPGGPFMSYRLTSGPFAGRYVYVAENITPTVSVGQTVRAGQQIAVMFDGGSGIETGWAATGGFQPLSQTAAAGSISGSNLPPDGGTAVAKDFDTFLHSLGVPLAPNYSLPTGGSLPAGWQAATAAPAVTSSSSASSNQPSDPQAIVAGTPQQNYVTIARFLMDHGYTKAAAAGIVGCIAGESAGDPESVGSGGGGLIGWTPLRPGLVTGNPTADLMTQLNAILTYNDGYSQYIPLLNSVSSPVDAADIYSMDFERPAVLYSDVRASIAQEVYASI